MRSYCHSKNDGTQAVSIRMQEKDEKANEIIYRNEHPHAALKPKFVKIPTTRQRG